MLDEIWTIFEVAALVLSSPRNQRHKHSVAKLSNAENQKGSRCPEAELCCFASASGNLHIFLLLGPQLAACAVSMILKQEVNDKGSEKISVCTFENLRALLAANKTSKILHPHQRCGCSDSPFARKDTFLYCRVQKWLGGVGIRGMVTQKEVDPKKKTRFCYGKIY